MVDGVAQQRRRQGGPLRYSAGAALALALVASCGARTGLLPADVEPTCPGLQTRAVQFGEVKQMDLLFVIDNSRSMADKQALLRDAVPALVGRLANPNCVNARDPLLRVTAPSSDAPCPSGYAREFEPVTDLHIGVISTSLGSAGGEVCTGGDESVNDLGRLLPTRPRGSGTATYRNLGFLDWDPNAAHLPPGEHDLANLQASFVSMIDLAGERGCGDEAVLESWYRFLIDPSPPDSIVVHDGISSPSGVDEVVLAQRKAFLRPDSAVAIVMLSDENDCSILQHGQGWLVGALSTPQGRFTLPSGTAACATDPNDACCRSCRLAEAAPPPGCPSLQADAGCQNGGASTDDPTNLRCFQQKRRFGFDFLYPTARYAVGLESAVLCPESIYDDADCACGYAKERAARLGLAPPPCTETETGAPVPNPLFQNLSGEPAFERDPSQIFLAGIVGVPWQDIATPATLRDPDRLEFLTASDLAAVDPTLGFDRWRLILGDLLLDVAPADPFMQESLGPRTGINPLTGDATVGPDSLDPNASPINGHERAVDDFDPQYACTFQLAEPRDCSTGGDSCECASPRSATDPVCQPPTGGLATTTQFYAKAFPALRELDVLRRHGANSVVSSICPKPVPGNSRDLGFGYGPALSSLVTRLHCATLDGSFDSDPTSPTYGRVDCRLHAVKRGSCACASEGRDEPSASDQIALREELAAVGLCGGNTGHSCAEFCSCEIPQATGGGLSACQNDPAGRPTDPDSGETVNGWCYVDPDAGFGSVSLVAQCPSSSLKNLRWLGSSTPIRGERVFAVCGGSCESARTDG